MGTFGLVVGGLGMTLVRFSLLPNPSNQQKNPRRHHGIMMVFNNALKESNIII